MVLVFGWIWWFGIDCSAGGLCAWDWSGWLCLGGWLAWVGLGGCDVVV